MTDQLEQLAAGHVPAAPRSAAGAEPLHVTAGSAASTTGWGTEVPASMLAAARLGDRGSFDCIIAHYDPRLRILAGQMMRDLSDADDALQEAYIKAYRALPGFRGDSALSSWLYRITYRCCLDQLRRRSVPIDSLEVLRETESADDDDPASLVASRDALRSALAMLTPIQRAVLFLIHCEDMSYGDAARVLDVPPGTVGSRVASARAALKNVLLAAGIKGGTR